MEHDASVTDATPRLGEPLQPGHAERIVETRRALSVEEFERVALPCLPDLARFARSLTHDPSDADDLVQETFLRAYRARETFLAGSDCRPWLFTICRRIHQRATLRDRRVVTVGDDDEAETFAAVRVHGEARQKGVEDMFTRLDVAPALADALHALSHPFRTAIQLVDVEGLSYEDAAGVLDVPVGTVRSRLFRARRLLQERLLLVAQDLGLAPGAADRRPLQT